MATNKHWENDFNEYDYDDYKSASVEWERLRQQNSTIGWIYIGMDTESRGRAKIGLTTGELGTRASSPQAPFYALLYAFKVREGVSSGTIHEIENATKGMLGQSYRRIHHVGSGELSEWFRVNPHKIRDLVHDFLYENYSQYMNCYNCPDRNTGVILSWQNDHLINGGSRLPYQPRDLSNPPVAFECLIPPGCGEDCDCW